MSQASDDPFMAFGGWLFYALDNIVPRLDLWYVSGGAYRYGVGFHPSAAVIDYNAAVHTFNGNQSYFNLRPSVQFRATAATWWEVGAVFNAELGSVSAAGGTSDQGLSYAIYTAVRVNF
jgi:hypothetical protein